MSRFDQLKQAPANMQPAPVHTNAPSVQANRQGRKSIAGYFSPAMSLAMRTTAMRRGISLQDAMGEAFNLWLRENGESPIGD